MLAYWTHRGSQCIYLLLQSFFLFLHCGFSVVECWLRVGRFCLFLWEHCEMRCQGPDEQKVAKRLRSMHATLFQRAHRIGLHVHWYRTEVSVNFIFFVPSERAQYAFLERVRLSSAPISQGFLLAARQLLLHAACNQDTLDPNMVYDHQNQHAYHTCSTIQPSFPFLPTILKACTFVARNSCVLDASKDTSNFAPSPSRLLE